jgi:VanZ family protein
MLELRLRGLWLTASVVLVSIVVWGSLQTSVNLPAPGGFDKVEHLGTYGFLAVWFTGLFPRRRDAIIALVLLGLGLSMEIGQYLMGMGRDADPFDMLANTVGVALGLVIARTVTGGWATRAETWLNPN